MRIFHCSFRSYKPESLYINLQNHMLTIYNDILLKKFNLCIELKRTWLESLSHISSISLQFPHNGLASSVWFRHLSAFHVTYQTREAVFHRDIQIPRRELKIRRAAECFWRNSRCLDSRWNTVSSVWYIFSFETKKLRSKRRNKIVKFYAN